jgi:DNA-binding CsgD family transcriptional regulator
MRADAHLHGRESEEARLRTALDSVDERGARLLVLGDPGIGKSSLVAAAATLARGRGMAVLTTSGVPSEAHLPFAGLHQMLQPVMKHADDLPASQRDSLLGALGQADTDVDDPMSVALAALNLVRDRAALGPLLLVAEDVHWLDRLTADVLAFVARRIDADPIVLVATSRGPVGEALGDVEFEELRLGPLEDDAAGAIIDAHAPGLDPTLRDRLLGEARGNPLALVELSIAWRRLPPGTLVASLVPVTTRLETTFASRVDTLPPAGRDLLLLAAVSEGEGMAEVLAAAAVLGHGSLEEDALAPAIGARLVEVDVGGLRFRHPLVRSTIYHHASPARRRAAHAALASTARDVDRIAWHRAAALVDRDEEAAAALEQAAARARRRGAVQVAVSALERAAELSPDPAMRGRRLVRAADHAHELGRRDVVVRLLDEAESLALDPVDRARAAWRRQVLVDPAVGDPARVQALVDTVGRMRDAGDVDMALDSLLTVAATAFRMGVGGDQAELIAAAAESLPVDAHEPRLVNVLGLVTPVARGQVVLDRLAAAAVRVADPGALGQLGEVAGIVGDQATAEDLSARAARGLRASGRLGALTQSLVCEAWAAWHGGDWERASASAGEARRLADQIARPGSAFGAHLVEGILAASRGDLATAHAAADAVGAAARQTGAETLLALTDLVRGLALLADGSVEAANELLRPRCTAVGADGPVAVSQALLPLYVDAAVPVGRVDDARRAVDAYERLARRWRSPTLAASLAYVRPLVADDEDAEAAYLGALEADLVRWPFLRARLLLAYGTWMRRQRRAVESRVPLRAAREACDALGAVPWGERARQELRAAGEASPTRSIAAAERLTAQELEIARLAASGLTNREIGQQLYLSHRTVGSHLYHVFPKLGVSSRVELAAALGEADSAGTAG